MPPAKKKDAFGATRLLRCCEKGDFKAVKNAYEASPDELDAPDYAGVTPLQKASLNGHEDIVEFLLNKGCATDGHDWLDHDTPLIDATQNGHVDVVKLLLWKARVDPMYENKHFKTALALLDPTIDEADEIKCELEKAMSEWKKEKSEDESEKGTPKSVEESVGPTLLPNEYNTEVLRIKSEQGDKRAVDELLASGIMPNVACGVAAARGGHDEILSFLLATGLSADHRDPAKHNETPMLVAIKKGHLNVIRLLLAQDDFDPTRKNRDGLTYWEFAEEFEGPNWKPVRDLLKEKYDERAKIKPRREEEAREAKRREEEEKARQEAEREGGIEYNFLPVHVAKHSDIDPACPETRRDELWMMSFQVVGILGLSELDIRQEFAAWEHKPVSPKQLHGFLETYDISQLAEDPLFERQNWPGYDPERQNNLIQEEKSKFLQLDPLFWVREASDRNAVQV
ncbi:hypothetical protein GTA08_BOTSDO03423 [Neofusicoccum parvum]|nr:hypothetical protein GTA08_BOTSDO03423 [Neofusicoccum parvum]